MPPHHKYRKQIVPQKPPELQVIDGEKDEPAKEKKRISWARLLKRIFDIDVTECPKCQGKMKIIAVIEDPAVIKKILNHLGLPAIAPRLKPARGPPEQEFTPQLFEN